MESYTCSRKSPASIGCWIRQGIFATLILNAARQRRRIGRDDNRWSIISPMTTAMHDIADFVRVLQEHPE